MKEILIYFSGFFFAAIPLYTGWFQYWPGLIDGLYKKSFSYWLEQHQIERIKGPFFYNSLIISIYEIWILPTLFVLGSLWIKIQNKKWRIIDIGFFSFILTTGLLIPNKLPAFFINILKIKNNIDYVLFFSIIYISLRTTIYLIQHKNIRLAFTSYLFFSSLFTYSFLGEKVPWLSLYSIIACAVWVTLLIPYIKTKYVNIIIIFLYISTFKTFYINFVDPGSQKELISQVHTSREYENILVKLQATLQAPVGAIKPQILVLENNGWPLSWFLWGYNGVNYSASIDKHKDYDFIFDRLLDSNRSGKLQETHTREVITLRHYWWPSFNEITFQKWLSLIILNQPWSPSGEFQISLWRKKSGFFSEQ